MSERLWELRWSLASEVDTDYNTQSDPKSLVLSSRTSPEKDNRQTYIQHCAGHESVYFTETNAGVYYSYLVCDNL